MGWGLQGLRVLGFRVFRFEGLVFGPRVWCLPLCPLTGAMAMYGWRGVDYIYLSFIRVIKGNTRSLD